jgi:putative membrane protein
MANHTLDTNAGAAPGKTPGAAPPLVDANTLALERTSMANERTGLALERTLEAWIRTALSMISFGFTLGKLVHSTEGGRVAGIFGERTWSVSGLAYFLVITGVAALAGATLQHWFRVRELHKKGLRRQFDLALLVAIIVCVAGAFAFTALVLDL